MTSKGAGEKSASTLRRRLADAIRRGNQADVSQIKDELDALNTKERAVRPPDEHR
jgi:hypothetical protein